MWDEDDIKAELAVDIKPGPQHNTGQAGAQAGRWQAGRWQAGRRGGKEVRGE